MVWSALRARELGKSVSTDLVWTVELGTLSSLHLQPSWNTKFKPVTHGCRDYIVQISTSQDEALLAAPSSNGTIEIHEPDDGDSLRLQLTSNHSSRVAACTWGKGHGDHIYVAHEAGTIHLFDLNKCDPNTPTQTISNLGSKRYITDIISLEENVFAVAHDELLHLYDARESWKRKIGTTARIGKEIAVAGAGLELYVASPGSISLYDRRRLPQGRAFLSMERSGTSIVRQRPLPEQCRLDMLRVLVGAPRGFLLYRTAKGSTGYIDMVGHAGEHITTAQPAMFEDNFQVSVGETGLQEYGTLRRSYDLSWHVRRRCGDVVCGMHGSGWRGIFPQSFRCSFEVVLFGHGRPMESYERALKHEVASMHVVGQKLDRILLGGIRNEMQLLEVDYSLTPIPLRNAHAPDHEAPPRTWWSRFRNINDSDVTRDSTETT